MRNKWKRFISIDRALLIVVLVVQILIIFHYLTNKDADRSAENTGKLTSITEPAPSPEENLSKMQLPLPPGYKDEQGQQRESIDDIFNEMHNQMNAMMRRAQMDFERIDSLINMNEGWDTLIRSPSMDIEEKPDRYIISLSIPGKSASDFSISLEGRILSISGRYEMQDTMGKSVQHYEKRVLLPRPVSSQNISKTFSDKGVLQIHIMKSGQEEQTEPGSDIDIENAT